MEIRCLDSSHPPTCQECHLAPTPAEAAMYMLRGDPGLKNGEKKLRTLVQRTPEWACNKKRMLCAEEAKKHGLTELVDVLREKDAPDHHPFLPPTLRRTGLRKLHLLFFTFVFRYKSDLWHPKKMYIQAKQLASKSVSGPLREVLEEKSGFNAAEVKTEREGRELLTIRAEAQGANAHGATRIEECERLSARGGTETSAEGQPYTPAVETWGSYPAGSDHIARVKTESGARLDDELEKYLWHGEGSHFGSSIESPHKTTECQKDSLVKGANAFENIKASQEYHDFQSPSQQNLQEECVYSCYAREYLNTRIGPLANDLLRVGVNCEGLQSTLQFFRTHDGRTYSRLFEVRVQPMMDGSQALKEAVHQLYQNLHDESRDSPAYLVVPLGSGDPVSSILEAMYRINVKLTTSEGRQALCQALINMGRTDLVQEMESNCRQYFTRPNDAAVPENSLAAFYTVGTRLLLQIISELFNLVAASKSGSVFKYLEACQAVEAFWAHLSGNLWNCLQRGQCELIPPI